MTPIIIIYLVIMMTYVAPQHVSASLCPDVIATANCSFEVSEPCSKDYVSHDTHGLSWSTITGTVEHIESTYNSYYGHNQNYYHVILSASPYGRYMYVQGKNDSRRIGLWTDLTSPAIDVHGGCLHFYYHNSVCEASGNKKKLKVVLRSTDDNDADITLREYECKSDNQWYKGHLSLTGVVGSYKVVFSAQHHELPNELVAVDHVMYTRLACSLRDDNNYEIGECDWESGDMCDYDIVETENTHLGWENIRESAYLMTRNTFRYGRREQILAISGSDNTSSPEEMVTISIQSPQVTVEEEGCLSLTYFCGRHESDNANVTALMVTRTTSVHHKANREVLHKFPSTLSTEWLYANIKLPRGEYALHFDAVLRLPYGQLENDLIAIDDIEIYQKSCDLVVCSPSFSRACSDTDACNSHGNCIGNGAKHYMCKCREPYLGKTCQYQYTYDTNFGFSPPEN